MARADTDLRTAAGPAASIGTLLRLAALFLCIALSAGVPIVRAEDSMQLDFRFPPYRQTIYATQDDQSIVVDVRLPAAMRAAVREIRARLVDGKQREVAVIRSGVSATDSLQFDGRTLAVGDYTVVASARGVNGVVIAEAQASVHKVDPAPGSEVRVDEHRNLIVNGHPSLQIGWYGTVRLDDPRPDVLRLQNLQTAIVVVYPDKSPVTRLFQEHGIRTMVNLEPGRLLYTFELWKNADHPVVGEHTRLSAPSAECREMLRKMIELMRDEPGLFGWYIADEPEINQFRVDYLEAYYQTIRELDPYHPVIVTNDTLEGIDSIGVRCCDILVPDPYSAKPNYVPEFLDRANRASGRGQGLMLTPWHAAQHSHFTGEFGSGPPYSYRVMRGQYLATLAAGGRGFVGYASDFFLPEPRLRIGLPHLWREVRYLEPFLHGDSLAGAKDSRAKSHSLKTEVEIALSASTADGAAKQNESPAPPTPQILSWIGKYDGHLTLIVMNGDTVAHRVSVQDPQLTMPALHVVSEGRQIAIHDRGFTDDVPAGEGCVYSDDPNCVKLPTVDEIEAEITKFEQSSAKPGNLLHVSWNVKARASSGTTPWFAQIFYYAINGITDDEGWHVTHAPLPQWIELAFAEPQSIQRIVLHTPNLLDYDLQFRSEDGSVFTAEVRGNQLDVAEHALASPIMALKVRLIARAIRADSLVKRPMVREIEAYSDAGVGTTAPLAVTRTSMPEDVSADIASTSQLATTATPPLWEDDFARFEHKPRLYEGAELAWALKPSDFTAHYDTAAKCLRCTTISPVGYASMSRLVPYSREYRCLQFSVQEIRGDGYQWLSVGLSDPSGKQAARSAVQTLKPGRYTVDTHALSDWFRQAGMQQALLSIYVMKGIDYAFSDIRLVQQPTDGLLVTMADGSPMPRVLKIGDRLLFQLFLNEPATDAVVELQRDSWYEPVRINGEPYVQLLKAGRDKDGRYWSAIVTLGEGTDTFHVEGYPVLFRATITGGALTETLSTLMVDIASAETNR
jgi:hypothetical protein